MVTCFHVDAENRDDPNDGEARHDIDVGGGGCHVDDDDYYVGNELTRRLKDVRTPMPTAPAAVVMPMGIEILLEVMITVMVTVIGSLGVAPTGPTGPRSPSDP